jgi:outer membrane protein assembly factor BamB
MSARELLKKLEQQGRISPKLLAKIRRQVEDASKRVSARSIVRFLVDQDMISRSEGDQLLAKSGEKPDQGQMTVPMDARHDDFNTDDLLGEHFHVVHEEPAVEPPAAPREPAPREPDVGWTLVDPQEAQRGAGRQWPRQEEPFFPERAVEMPAASMEAAPPQPTFAGKKVRGNPWESKWLFIGFGLLLLLVFTTVGLWWFLTRVTAEEAFADAEKKFSDGNYPAARDAYLDFVEKFSGESKVPLAQAKAVNAHLRSTFDSNNWAQTKNTAVSELNRLLESENNEISAIADDLTVILPKTALGLSQMEVDAVETEAKESLLAESDEVMALVNNPAILPTSRLKADYVQPILGDRQKNVDQVRYEIQRERSYQDALVTIAGQTDAGNTDQAITSYHSLIRQYPILRTRQPLRDLVAKISEKESELVVPANVTMTTAAADAPGGTAARALLVAQTGSAASIPVPKTIPYLVNGTIYGLSAADGAIRWWRYVGFQTSIQPQWVETPFESDLIVADQARNELARLSLNDGSVIWRTQIGEPFLNPAITPGRLFVTTTGGNRSKVVRLNIDNGQVELACQLPQLATVGPVPHGDVGLLYQVGRHSNIYILSQEDLSCAEVHYIGHQPDSVDVEPFLVSGNLCVLVNFALHCDAHVYGFRQRGLEAFESQPAFKIADGKVTQPVYRYGRSVIVSSDSGDVRMYELAVSLEGDQTAATLQPQVLGKIPTYDGVSNYFAADRGDMYVANRGFSKFRIQRSEQSFELRKAADNADTFIGPVYAFESFVIHLRRRFRSSMVTAAAVNPETLEEIWRTDFGVPPLDAPFVADNRLLAVSRQGDLFEVTPNAMQEGVLVPIARGTAVKENLDFGQRLTVAGDTAVLVGQQTDRVLAYGHGQLSDPRLNPLQPPANRTSGDSAAMNSYLLVPCLTGQVARIEPATGAMVGAPFQPAVNPNQSVRWTAPAVFDEVGLFVIGTDQGQLFSVAADEDKSLIRRGQLDHDAAFVSPVVRVGEQVVVISRSATSDQILLLNVQPELAQAAAKTLPQQYAGHLMAIEQRILYQAADGGLVCLGTDLNEVWRAPLEGRIAGRPRVEGDALLVSLERGDLVWLNAENGTTIKSVSLGVPLASEPVPFQGNLFVFDQLGAIHLVGPVP